MLSSLFKRCWRHALQNPANISIYDARCFLLVSNPQFSPRTFALLEPTCFRLTIRIAFCATIFFDFNVEVLVLVGRSVLNFIATTAKPRPCSLTARAAYIAAFKSSSLSDRNRADSRLLIWAIVQIGLFKAARLNCELPSISRQFYWTFSLLTQYFEPLFWHLKRFNRVECATSRRAWMLFVSFTWS